MSTNNFPIIWDSEADDGLFGSLFENNLMFPENFSNQDSNAYANDTIFGKESLFFTPEYISKNIDFVKLVELINNRKDIVFDYERYVGHATRQITHRYLSDPEASKFDRAAGIPTSYTETETYETENQLLSKTFGNRELKLEGKLNTSKAVVNITKDNEQDYTGGLEFEFDLSKKIAIYKLHYYYLGKSRVFESNNHKNNIAFTISSSNFEDFEELLKIAELGIGDSNFKTKIEKQFLNAITTTSLLEDQDSVRRHKYNKRKFKPLDWLYANVPKFVAAKLDFDEVIKNVFKLNLWDRSSILDDSTASITKIISLLDPRTVYNYFYANPDKLITLFNEFKDEELIKSFCNYLTTITLNYNPPNNDEIRKFNIGENQHIETNILYGDDKGKVELTNELQLPMIYGRLILIQLILNDLEINNPETLSNQFHPLDIISIRHYDENLKEVSEVPAVALYGKYLGDKGEWSDVIDITLAIIDIISIATSGGALAAGVKGVARIIALTDIAVATVNLSLLNSDLKNELNRSEAGRWFVSNWPIISFGIGLGTISYYLAKGILKYGPQVRQQIKNDEKLVKQIDELEKESKKVAAELDNLGNVSGRGRRLGQKLSKSAINDLVGYLKKQGCDFEIFPINGSHEIRGFIGSNGKSLIFEKGKQAAFVYTRTNMKFIVREGATVYETLHEFIHFKHAKSIGLPTYHSLGGANSTGELLKEQRVFNKMIEYKELLTRGELKHAVNYINEWIYKTRGIETIEFSFDINKIPEVRKEIDIKNIFNLK